MAITKSAKKAIRGSERKRVFNVRRKRAMHDATHGETIDLATAYQAIDKAMKRGVIKKNTAARKKSRLAARLKKAAGK